MQEREKNRAAIGSLVLCTHFLTRHHIAHSTNFIQLVDLVVSCGARVFKLSLKMPQGMQYTLLEGQWLTLSKNFELRSRSLKKGSKASVFSVMADECTDIMAVEELSVLCCWEDMAVEELSVLCCWEEDGIPVKCFLDIVPLKKADTGSIYLALSCVSKTKIFRLAIL